MKTNFATSLCIIFDHDALEQIADATDTRARLCRAEAKKINTRDGYDAARPYLHDADTLRQAAYYLRSMLVASDDTKG